MGEPSSWRQLEPPGHKVVCERVRQATLGVDVVVQREHEDGGQLRVRVGRVSSTLCATGPGQVAIVDVGREVP